MQSCPAMSRDECEGRCEADDDCCNYNVLCIGRRAEAPCRSPPTTTTTTTTTATPTTTTTAPPAPTTTTTTTAATTTPEPFESMKCDAKMGWCGVTPRQIADYLAEDNAKVGWRVNFAGTRYFQKANSSMQEGGSLWQGIIGSVAGG